MLWAAYREATRDEDLAYSLLGIFDINMTMQYGEGEKAFLRLQKEITRTTNDMSIFARGFTAQPIEDIRSDPGVSQERSLYPHLNEVMAYDTSYEVASHGLCAAHPSSFSNSRDIVHLAQHVSGVGTDERHGTQIVNTAMVFSPGWTRAGSHQWAVAFLPCILVDSPHSLVGIVLKRWHHGHQRVMRRAFTHTIYSCLIPGRHTRDAKQQEFKVDTWDTQHSMRLLAFDESPIRTVVVKFDNIDNYPFEFLNSTPGQKYERDSHHVEVTRSSFDSNTILRFHRPYAPLAVMRWFQIRSYYERPFTDGGSKGYRLHDNGVPSIYTRNYVIRKYAGRHRCDRKGQSDRPSNSVWKHLRT